MKLPKPTEAQEHRQLVQWLKVQYPNVLFNTDMSGIKLSKGLATKCASLRSHSGMPDLQILEPRGTYGALFIELKRSGEKLFKKDGTTPASDHIKNQMKVSLMLYERGYKSVFAIGFEQAKKEITDYLNYNFEE